MQYARHRVHVNTHRVPSSSRVKDGSRKSAAVQEYSVTKLIPVLMVDVRRQTDCLHTYNYIFRCPNRIVSKVSK